MAVIPIDAEEVYYYDFQSLPSGWTADSEWTFGGTGTEATVSAWGGPPTSSYAVLESDSLHIILPAGTDSVQVAVDESHVLDGYFTTGEAYASVYVNAYLNGDFISVFSASESWGFWERDSDDVSSVTFPAAEGDALAFRFRTSASAFGGYATATLHVNSMTVTAYNGLALYRSTWASIKCSI